MRTTICEIDSPPVRSTETRQRSAATLLLIAEDAALIRRLLALQLSAEHDFEVIGEAANGREAVRLAAELCPDVVVMDLDMPLLNGVQATQRILIQRPETKVLVLTAYEDLLSLAERAGACHCLTKRCTPEELASAIRRAMTARPDSESARASSRKLAIDCLAMRVGLTDNERTVVEMVVSTNLPASQIARQLSEKQARTVTSSAVKHALARAMTRMPDELRTRAALIKYVVDFANDRLRIID